MLQERNPNIFRANELLDGVLLLLPEEIIKYVFQKSETQAYTWHLTSVHNQFMLMQDIVCGGRRKLALNGHL